MEKKATMFTSAIEENNDANVEANVLNSPQS